MQKSIHLDEADIKRAIQAYVSDEETEGQSVLIWVDPGDPPLSGQTIHASVIIEGKHVKA